MFFLTPLSSIHHLPFQISLLSISQFLISDHQFSFYVLSLFISISSLHSCSSFTFIYPQTIKSNSKKKQRNSPHSVTNYKYIHIKKKVCQKHVIQTKKKRGALPRIYSRCPAQSCLKRVWQRLRDASYFMQASSTSLESHVKISSNASSSRRFLRS